jgi:hypothetical protein
LNAWENEWSKGSLCHDRRSVAAVLRTAAQSLGYEAYGDGWFELVVDVSDLYAIADELEQLDA